MSQELFCPGLRGVIAGETEICNLDHGIQYRGYALQDLTDGSTFIEVAHLLLFDELPSEEQFADFLSVIQEEQQLPFVLQELYEQFPVHNLPLEVLRTGISLLNLFDHEPQEDLLQSYHSQTINLLAKLPLMVAAWHRLRNGLPQLAPRPELSHVGNIYYLLTGDSPCALFEEALDVALICAMEHELTPSSFVARVVGSVRSNQYSPVLAALDAFIGMIHGGGDDRPLDVLNAVGSPDRAEEWIAKLDSETSIPGFGHPVYRECDPRAAILDAQCEKLAMACGRTDLEKLAEAIETTVWKHRKLPANIDWPLARLFAYLGFDRDLFRPVFVMSRMVGWSAHAYEQCECNEPIRPRARYRGAVDCPFESIRDRDNR
ncbi:MAG: citrate/2-methylcitrate synthase [Planctomycetaceae bacterium]|nr:citrate/2-methylcitrate synthase [Planctomycetaceae bacterium]